MRIIAFLIVTFFAYSSGAATFDPTLDDAWNGYQKLYNKKYTTVEESTHRRLTWEDNLKFVNKHNLEFSLGQHTFTVAMNKYADMTNKEFVNKMNKLNFSSGIHRIGVEYIPSNVKIPDSVDWRTKGYVNSIRDQGQCGSCWGN
jgi:cathepsin L